MRRHNWMMEPLLETPGGTGGGGGSAATQDPPTPPARPAAKLPMTQEELDDLVAARLGRARSQWEREMGVSPDEVKRLRQLEADQRRKVEEEKGNYEKALQQVQKEKDEEVVRVKTFADSLRAELQQERCHNRVAAAAANLKAYNAEQVARLLGDRVKLNDENKAVVYDEDGKPAFKNGRPMTVDQLVADFLVANPHMAQPSGAAGAGSKGGGSVDDRQADATDDITKLEAELADLQKRAATTHDTALITKAHQVKRKIEELRKKKQGA